MDTKKLYPSSENDIALAGSILRRGGVVAVPTETVYGLAASAYCGEAVKAVFRAKGRPQDNPLIVHITELSQLEGLAFPTEDALRLAAAYWPGPMTMVMKKGPKVAPEVTAGLDTVGIRMPSHPDCRAVINAAGVPLAAPSANLSGKPSPTSAEHVLEDMSGRIDGVIMGGDCAVGVESTVIDMTGDIPTILRPGAVTLEMIIAVLGKGRMSPALRGKFEGTPPSPGMKYRHYAPKAPLTLVRGAPDAAAEYINENRSTADAVICFTEYLPLFPDAMDMGESWDHEAHSHRVFALLRQADEKGCRHIFVQCPRPAGAGAAAADRLGRASAGDIVNVSPRAVIGLTGASGSGKSLISSHFAKKGWQVLDADAIYHELLAGGEMVEELKKAFPEAVRDNGIDLRLLGPIVFSDEGRRLTLNGITHKYVRKEMLRRLDADPRPAVLDVPLLFESGLDRACTLTVGVTAPYDLRLSRIIARDGISEDRARARLDAAKPDEYYRKRCDIILINDGSSDVSVLIDTLIPTEEQK